MGPPPRSAVPRGLLVAVATVAVLPVAFLATGPWHFGNVHLRYLNIVIAAGVVLSVTVRAMLPRRLAGEAWLDREVAIPNRFVWLGVAVIAAMLMRLVLNQFAALGIDAWDFSLYADRPLAATAQGRLLWSEYLGGSTLGNHAGFLLLAFVPLYFIHPSPLWLLFAPPVAVALASAVLFFVIRRISGDDVVAGTLALAFFLNASTARAVGYVFHLEVFYPLGIFLLAWALLAQRPWVFGVALALTLAIKEDALIPLLGFAAVAWGKFNRRTWAMLTAAAALAVYVVDSRLVLPHFGSRDVASPVWYSWYWASFGPTPAAALFGMLRHPLEVASRFVCSGGPSLLLSLLFIPVVGWEWCLAAMPGLLVYGASDAPGLSQLSIYYAMPLLPLLFLALPDGIGRVATWRRRNATPAAKRRRCRIIALAVLATSALLDSPYKLREPRAEGGEVKTSVASVTGTTPVLVQGALMPHAGYDERVRVLDRAPGVDGRAAFLIAPTANPYPFSRAELEALVQRLSDDPRYLREQTPTGLLLFRPAML